MFRPGPVAILVRPKPAGEATWQQASHVLDAYRGVHPLKLRDASQ